MSIWGEIFLGVIALATLVMAIGQILVAIAAGRVAKRIGRFADAIEHEIEPVLGHVNAIARDAARAASLASAQVERVDRLFGDLLVRFESLLGAMQDAITSPLRHAPTFVTGFRTVLDLIREFRAGRRRARPDEEDALFI